MHAGGLCVGRAVKATTRVKAGDVARTVHGGTAEGDVGAAVTKMSPAIARTHNRLDNGTQGTCLDKRRSDLEH
jgi:hypothetical protein